MVGVFKFLRNGIGKLGMRMYSPATRQRIWYYINNRHRTAASYIPSFNTLTHSFHVTAANPSPPFPLHTSKSTSINLPFFIFFFTFFYFFIFLTTPTPYFNPQQYLITKYKSHTEHT